MDIQAIYKVLLPPFRKRRMKDFKRTFAPTSKTAILDVGGTSYNWRLIDCQSQVTILNLSLLPTAEAEPDYFKFVVGNGMDMKYADGEFDICYSNSVIEHLGSYENQMKFAGEVRRVGREIWVQTPSRCFFFEPNFLTPFIHFLPKKLQRKLVRNLTTWGLFTRPDQDEVDKFLAEIRLLTYAEMKFLFPDCVIRREKFLLFTKAFIAVRKR